MLFTHERNGKVKSVVNSIPSRFLKFVLRCWKIHLHTGSNVYTESSRGSWFVIKRFLGVLKLSNTRSILGTNLIFPFTFIKAWLMLIQNNIYCCIETTTWTKIEESPKYKFQGLLYKIRAASDISQKGHFFWKKRTPKILPSPIQPLF